MRHVMDACFGGTIGDVNLRTIDNVAGHGGSEDDRSSSLTSDHLSTQESACHPMRRGLKSSASNSPANHLRGKGGSRRVYITDLPKHFRGIVYGSGRIHDACNCREDVNPPE